jgi:hypothetical protein
VPRRLLSSLTETERKQLIAAYTVERRSMRELVEVTGWSYGSVNNMLHQLGVDVRPRGGNQRKRQSSKVEES